MATAQTDRRPRPGEALIAAGIRPMAPGAFLAERLLPHRGMTVEEAAAAMHVPAEVFRDVLSQRRRVDPDMAERLSQFSGLSAGFWLNMQAAFELA